MLCDSDYRLPVELDPDNKPGCFTEDEWLHWVASEIVDHLPIDPNGFCSACTPEFKASQIARGGCYHPWVEFENDDGGVVGTRPGFAQWAALTQVPAKRMEEIRAQLAERIADLQHGRSLSAQDNHDAVRRMTLPGLIAAAKARAARRAEKAAAKPVDDAPGTE